MKETDIEVLKKIFSERFNRLEQKLEQSIIQIENKMCQLEGQLIMSVDRAVFKKSPYQAR